MMPVELVDGVGDHDAAVRAVVERLLAGQVVVIPTETVYGVAASATDPEAVEELFLRKGRSTERLMAVLVADVAQARALAVIDERFERLAEAMWPGPLTMVLPRRPDAGLTLGLELEGPATIGIRCPDHELARAVSAEVGPIVTTSANRSGEETPSDAVGAATALGGDLLAVEGGPCTGVPSTVLDLTVNPARILRLGTIGPEELASVGVPVGR
ncbi:MAG TPA: threonylcarbamoyl-AMP synthase [Acidimicrobiaceae bacterium]|nr:threonylcarbamoyl-AMP synthase [Acidimicrobiaceae bacterium]HCV33953.1 threonylcarbamoyl-AMP synthase [Acidimicrobiaceae bacterium]|tara:strand:- start:3293 stop:3934 length:642 start_codon:yes stop_codon:yes gene_type:complete